MAQEQRKKDFKPVDLLEIASDLKTTAGAIEAVAASMPRKQIKSLPMDGISKQKKARGVLRAFYAALRGRLEELSCLGTKH